MQKDDISLPLHKRVLKSTFYADAYTRHRQLMQYYHHPENLRVDPITRTDIDEIRDHFKFLPDTTEDDSTTDWQMRMVKLYHDRLFKEYCLGDFSRASDHRVALRWRVEDEVISGKGQFICGNMVCDKISDLEAWEVNFGYLETGIKKKALVKIVLCPACTVLLNHARKK